MTNDGTDGTRRAHPGRRIALAVVIVLVAALGGGYLWWTAPARAIKAELRGLDLPDAVRSTQERISDHGRICFDSCSSGSRDYETSLPARDTIEALAAALRARGFTVEVEECKGSGCRFANTDPLSLRTFSWSLSGAKGGLRAHASAGARVDGRPGATLSIAADEGFP